MGGLSIWHWLIVGIVVMLLFGKGRFSDMMGDVAKGIKSFKKGMADDEDAAAPPRPVNRIEGQQPPVEVSTPTVHPAPVTPASAGDEPKQG
jgi:sec-independent protein translocase protein TatA